MDSARRARETRNPRVQHSLSREQQSRARRQGRHRTSARGRFRRQIYLARGCARTLRGSCNDATFATAHRGYATCPRGGGSLPVLVQRPLVATTNGLSLSLPPWPLHTHNAHPRGPGNCHRMIIRDDDRVMSRYHTSAPRERRTAVRVTSQHNTANGGVGIGRH